MIRSALRHSAKQLQKKFALTDYEYQLIYAIKYAHEADL